MTTSLRSPSFSWSSSSLSSKMMPRTTVILLFFFCGPSLVSCMCPRVCRCSLDHAGHKLVICDQGGMLESIPATQMEYDIWKLVVTAPPNNLNNLAISRIFYRFTQLREIHITNSLLPAIGDETFKGLYKLQVLNLTDNNITQLLESNFQDLTSLRELYLDNNNIQHMPSAAFHNLPNLTILSMSRNKIEQLVPRLFLKLDKLQELNLNSNPLRGNIDADRFKDLGKLRILRLSDCHQTQFNSMALQYLLSLETLDLSHNRLKFFTIDESSHFPHFVPKLKYLYLHDNQIQSIFNGTFGGLSLRQLTMSFNQLQFLQRESFSNVIVEDLDLSFNNLKITDPGLLSLLAGKLQKLHIGGNRMSQYTLSQMLSTLPKLHTLGISHLKLKEINTDILHFPLALKHFNVSGNGLSRFPVSTLASLTHLEILDLSRNNFRGLDRDLIDQLDSMSKLHRLYLDGNPWACNLCYIPVMLAWLNNSRYFEKACVTPSPDPKYCLRCSSPAELSGRPVQLLDREQLGGCDELHWERNVSFHQGHIGLVVACVILFLLLVSVIVVLVMYYRRGAEYYTHEEDREEDGIYENPGVDDETGDLLNDKKMKVTLPPSPLTATLLDGNGHSAQGRAAPAFSNSNSNAGSHQNATHDNGRVNSRVAEHY